MKPFALTASLGGALEYTLRNAILIYSGKSGHALATMHDIEMRGDVPHLGPGQLPQPEAVKSLAMHLLSRKGGMELLDPRLIAFGLGGMAWHCPPSRRRLWFAPSNDDDKAALKPISGEVFPQPGLIFVVQTHGIVVLAVRTRSSRPEAKTAVYRAPYWNLDSRGYLCQSGTEPDGVSPSLIGAYEKSFFQSNFSHPNAHGVRLTTHPGGHNALWQSLQGARQFPERTLVRMTGDNKKPLYLGDFL